MKRLPALTCLLATLSLAADDTSAIDAELKKTWPNNRTINIVFHGHSVPSGYHLAGEVRPFESYPHLFRVALNNRYPTAVINVITTSIGGENAVNGATRFNADVLPHKPDLLLIDYAINDRKLPIEDVETAWRAMISAAKTATIPVILITPTGVNINDFSDPTDPLAIRSKLIRTLAAEEDVMLADVSAAWLAALESGTNENDLLSQGNHPNLAGHTLAADVIFQTYLAGLGNIGSVTASQFPRDQSTNTFTTSDTLLTFTTTNTFSGQANFVGNSGGAGNQVNSWDGSETLGVDLAANAELTGFQVRWTTSDIIISGFTSDPGASISPSAGTSATWDAANSTLTLDLPWDGGDVRTISFANPDASTGSNLDFSFSDSSAGWQTSFVSFDYQATRPPTGTTPFNVPIQFNGPIPYFSFQGLEDHSYQLEASPDMTPMSWSTIDTSGPLTASLPVTLSDSDPIADQKFYRIAVTFPE